MAVDFYVSVAHDRTPCDLMHLLSRTSTVLWVATFNWGQVWKMLSLDTCGTQDWPENNQTSWNRCRSSVSAFCFHMPGTGRHYLPLVERCNQLWQWLKLAQSLLSSEEFCWLLRRRGRYHQRSFVLSRTLNALTKVQWHISWSGQPATLSTLAMDHNYGCFTFFL